MLLRPESSGLHFRGGFMRKVVISRTGGPDVLKVQEVADLTAAYGEMLIEVRAAGVNFADILARQGLYMDAPPLPATVGYEVSGVVRQVADGVCQSWVNREVIALTQFGGYASQVVVPQSQVFLKPEGMSFEEGACVPVNYLTAYQLLVAMGSLQAGETVLIHNAGGGVGLAALDIARHKGAITLGTASAHKHDFLRERGLDYAIDYQHYDWEKMLQYASKGRGVDVIIDPVGGAHWRRSYRNLSPTGRLGMFGISMVTSSGLQRYLNLLKMALSTPLFHPFALMNANKAVFGVNLGRLWHEQAKIRAWADYILGGYEQGWVRPCVDQVFSFAEAGEAHAYIEARKNIGKVVLTP